MYSLIIYKDDKEYGKRSLVDVRALSIGSDEVNDIVLDDPTSVSKVHAGIYNYKEGNRDNFIIQDLGSKEGIKINGNKLGYWILYEDCKIDIGSFTIELKKEKDDEEDTDKLVCELVDEKEDDKIHIKLNPLQIPEKESEEIKNSDNLENLLKELDNKENPNLGKKLDVVIQKLTEMFNIDKILFAKVSLDDEQLITLASYPEYKKGNSITISRTAFNYVKHKQLIVAKETIIDKDKNNSQKNIELFIPICTDRNINGLLYIEFIRNYSIPSIEIEFLAKLAGKISLIIPREIKIQDKQKEETNYQSKYLMDNSIIGISKKMKILLDTLKKYAEFDSTVLLLGETGTGKNLVAEFIHDNSKRKKSTLIEVNCAAIPQNLINSELFGSEKGSFTGATELRKGKFELADKSTLFLNEIGDFPLELQAKLLDAINDKKIWRVGGQEAVDVDIRFISATNHDLAREVRNGNFRLDLYQRLNIISIEVPPLRERTEDIMFLAGYFLFKFRQKYAKWLDCFSPECVDLLSNWKWPGNVRELNAAVERAVVNTKDGIIRLDDFDLKSNLESELGPLKEMKKLYVQKVLKYTKNKTKASEILKITRSTINKILDDKDEEDK